jgi:hypothetical protein
MFKFKIKIPLLKLLQSQNNFIDLQNKNKANLYCLKILTAKGKVNAKIQYNKFKQETFAQK